MSTTYYVYVLADPRDNTIHYVGMSKNPQKRLSEHLLCKEPNQGKTAWIQGLKRVQMEPILRIIDQAEDREAAKTFEEFWIGFYRRGDQPLTNMLTIDLFWRGVNNGTIERGH